MHDSGLRPMTGSTMTGSTKGQKLFTYWPCLRTPFHVHCHTETIFLNSPATRGSTWKSLSVAVVKGSTTEHRRLANKSLKTLDIDKYSGLGWLDQKKKSSATAKSLDPLAAYGTIRRKTVVLDIKRTAYNFVLLYVFSFANRGIQFYIQQNSTNPD
jgi:hypothetical protein